MPAGQVPTSNMNVLKDNTTAGVTASPTAVDAGLQDIIDTVDTNAAVFNTFQTAADLEIVDQSIRGPKIRNEAITTEKIANLAVTTPKIALGAVGAAQLNQSLFTDFGDIAVQAQLADIVTLKPSGVDDTTAINNALNTKKKIIFGEGIFYYNGKITLTLSNSNNRHWVGQGSSNTTIQFTDSTVTALIERQDVNSGFFSIEGICFKGPGMGVGSSIHGFYSDASGSSLSNNLRMIDVGVVGVSGDGFHVTDWFQQYWNGCYAREIGGHGFVISGDQAPTFICSGIFNYLITGYSWWFQGGRPFLQNLNTGQCGNGIKFGRNSTDPRGASYCFPTIIGLNIEGVYTNGGIGVYIGEGSNISYATGISIYAYNATVLYGVYAFSLGAMGFLVGLPSFSNIGTGTFTNKFYVNGGASTSGILVVGDLTAGIVGGSNSGNIARVIGINFGANGFSIPSLLNANGGVNVTNKMMITKYRTITVSENIRRDSGVQDDYIILANATSGQINLSMDYGTFLPNRTYIIKKTDASANVVRINPITLIDGADYYDLTTQNQTVTIWASGSGTDWTILSKG